MTYERYEKLLVKLDGNVLRVTLNKPDKRNIVDSGVSAELADVFTQAGLDPAIGVVLFTGAGTAFCAGGDIVGMQQKLERPQLFYQSIFNSRRLVFSILDCPKPVVCRLNGDAIGLGATLALLCDIVIANEAARIADPHVKVGLVAGDGGALIWPALIGFARAKRYLLTGDILDGRQAAEIGLVTQAVPLSELDRVTEEWVQRLAQGALQSIACTKLTLNVPLRQAAQALLDVGMAYEGLSNISNDHREAVNAFMEKRAPKFTGD